MAASSARRLITIRKVTIVPRNNSKEKNAAMRALGAELIEFGNDLQDALEHAERLAREAQLHFVESFNRILRRRLASSLLIGLPVLPRRSKLRNEHGLPYRFLPDLTRRGRGQPDPRGGFGMRRAKTSGTFL